MCVQIWPSENVMTYVITVEFDTSMRQAGSDYRSSNWADIEQDISCRTTKFKADKPAQCFWAADLRC